MCVDVSVRACHKKNEKNTLGLLQMKFVKNV